MSEKNKDCKICREGAWAEHKRGKLIRPCLCKQFSYAHVKCIDDVRTKLASGLLVCPKCNYRYRCVRARVAGLADNKVVIGTISGFLFLCIVMISSFITGYFMDAFDQPSSFGAGYFFLFSPFAVVQDLVAAAIRVIRDEELAGIFSEPISRSTRGQSQASPGLIQNFIYRFLIGLPLVGAGSIVQVLVSFGMLAPTQFIARYRATRRKYNSRDLAALIVVALLAAGAIRAIFQVYKWTQHFSRKTLLRVEHAILEVS